MPVFANPPTSVRLNNGFASSFPGVCLLSSCQASIVGSQRVDLLASPSVHIHSQLQHPWGQFAVKTGLLIPADVILPHLGHDLLGILQTCWNSFPMFVPCLCSASLLRLSLVANGHLQIALVSRVFYLSGHVISKAKNWLFCSFTFCLLWIFYDFLAWWSSVCGNAGCLTHFPVFFQTRPLPFIIF